MLSKIETEHFSLETGSLTLRVGRSGSRSFVTIIQKRPLVNVCHLDFPSDKPWGYTERRARAMMELLELGLNARKERSCQAK